MECTNANRSTDIYKGKVTVLQSLVKNAVLNDSASRRCNF
jgi:hypothetical protein